jgi:hypothetical protein
MGEYVPLLQGWKQWALASFVTASWLTVLILLMSGGSEDPLTVIGRVLAASVFLLIVLVPQAVVVALVAYFTAKPPIVVVAILIMLVVLANLAVGAALGAWALLLGPPAPWGALVLFASFGAGLFGTARHVWRLSPKLAAIPVATFVVLKLAQQLVLPQLRGG